MANQGGGGIGSIIGGTLGAVVGWFASGGNPAGALWGFSLGSMVGGIGGQLLFPVEQKGIEGARLNDLFLQGATYGIGIPKIYGTTRIAGNIIWSTDIKETAHQESAGGGGGKGGGKDGPTVTTYTYSISLAIGLCEGPISAVRRVWANNELLFDLTAPAPVPGKEDAFFIQLFGDQTNEYLQSRVRLYKGTETQMPDPHIEAIEGTNNAPAYRGLAYVVIENLQLTEDFHNVPPNFEFEVVVNGTTVAQAVFLEDTPDTEPGWAGHMAIDPMTGYVWATRQGIFNQGQIVVIDPTTNTIVKQIEIWQPLRIAYQPPYVTYQIGLTGVDIHHVPPAMWVGANYPTLLGSRIYQIDPVTYTVTEHNVANSAFVWPGNVWWDPYSVDVFKANPFGSGRLFWNTSNGYQNSFTNDPESPTPVQTCTYTGVSFPSPPYTNFQMGVLADGTWGDGFFWAVDWKSLVWKVKITDGLIDAQAVALSGAGAIANIQGRCDYDHENHCLYTLTADWPTGYIHVIKWDSSLNEVWHKTYNDPTGANPLTNGTPINIRYHAGVGDLWMFRNQFQPPFRIQACRLDLETGDILEIIDTDVHQVIWDVMLYPGQPYAYMTAFAGNASLGNNSGVFMVPLFFVPTPTPPTLASIVSDLCLDAGYEPSEIDVTALTADTVDGFVLSDKTAARRAIEPLQRCYYFDAVESDWQIKFSKRASKTPVATIVVDDLAARRIEKGADGKTPPPLGQQRTQDSELPNHIDVRYLDKDRLYKTTTQYARRLIGSSNRSSTINLPIVVSAQKAKEVGDIAIYAAWMGRDRGVITTTKKYLALDPGDVVLVEYPAATFTRYIIVKSDYTMTGLIQFELTRDESSMYSSDLPAVSAPPVTDPVRRTVQSLLHLLDIPTLEDNDDYAGLYYGMTGVTSGWTGATIWRSADDGATYDQMGATSTEATAGFADTVLNWEGSIT